MELDDVARDLEAAGADLAAVGTQLAVESPATHAFGANESGALGELGRALHAQLASALVARVGEARGLGAATADLAGALRGAASGYRDVESTRRNSTGGAPTSGAPTSGAPTSGAHTSGAPVGGALGGGA